MYTDKHIAFSDTLTNTKQDAHDRILFQNVNSLDISTYNHTLVLTCDGIDQHDIIYIYIYIYCLPIGN